MMRDTFLKAHAMTREIKAQYPEVDYRAQFGLNLSYLLNKEEEEVMKITDYSLTNEGQNYILRESLQTKNIKGNPVIPSGTPVSFKAGLTGITIYGDVVKDMDWVETNSVELGPFDVEGEIETIRNLKVEKATPDNVQGVDFKVFVTGNTYPIKEEIKKDGGKWNPSNRAWILPADFKNWRKYETNSTSIQIEFIERKIK